MIKIVEEMKDQEGFQEFQKFFSSQCESICEDVLTIVGRLKNIVDAEFVNMEEVKQEIKELIMVKLTVKVPEKYIKKVPVTNAQVDKIKLKKKPLKIDPKKK